jgi:NTE family protein
VSSGKTAFVLGGGGQLGAHEVGMLQALLESGVQPDLVAGTSIGAINGAAVAADPTPEGIERLARTWTEIESSDAFDGSVVGRLATLAKTRTHLHGIGPLKRLLEQQSTVERIEDLPVPFQCVAACIETASEHWFTEGRLVDAVLASCSVPGILPPYKIGDRHFLDGGVVNSIPVNRAVELGADEIYVLHVGRIERGLEPPRWPWEVGLVAFEIARRHRFFGDMAALPEEVKVHVMPTGQDEAPRFTDLSQFKYRDTSRIANHIERAYVASKEYLAEGG